jgi:UDP-2,4-diacetamido-2,4,6-trideoxy-beta-L-altropyranose hydrolase
MTLTWRNARLSDADDLFLWRNDKIARINSGNSDQITWDQHKKWLSSRVERQSTEPFFIFYCDSEPVGTARYDLLIDAERSFEISLLVNPIFRNLGFGKRILNESLVVVTNLFPENPVSARILPENSTSIRIFLASGFSLSEKKGKFLVFRKD